MKIFKNNLKKNTTGKIKEKLQYIGNTKYLPSFSKEWKNTVYSYNKNLLKNIPVTRMNINNIIKSYFNLFFKNYEYINSKFISLKKKRKFFNRIYVSNPEIKYTSSKAIITLYAINREKNFLTNKFLALNEVLSKKLIKRYFYLYKNHITTIHNILWTKFVSYNYIGIISKKKYIFYKLLYLKKYLKFKNVYSKKIWSIILNKYSIIHLKILKKSYLMYSLNQSKFNKLNFLPGLSNILNKITKKKIEYKIINLKSIAYNSDIFTDLLVTLIRKKKKSTLTNINRILSRASLPLVNTITERTPIKIKSTNSFLNKYKDLKIISHLGSYTSLVQLVNKIGQYIPTANSKYIHNIVYNAIRYKNLGGIKLEVNGRLTPRYRADRSLHFLKWKGGLKNIDSSYQRLTSVLFRGNTNSNVSYSFSSGKRRVGAFAVKGWIGGK